MRAEKIFNAHKKFNVPIESLTLISEKSLETFLQKMEKSRLSTEEIKEKIKDENEKIKKIEKYINETPMGSKEYEEVRGLISLQEQIKSLREKNLLNEVNNLKDEGKNSRVEKEKKIIEKKKRDIEKIRLEVEKVLEGSQINE